MDLRCRFVSVMALACCLVLPTVASAGKALRLGGASPVIGGLSSAASSESADLVSDLKTDTPADVEKAKGQVKERLKKYGYTLVTMDLKTASRKHAKILAAAAAEADIDMVLENSTKEAMADVVGLGLDAAAAVVRPVAGTNGRGMEIFLVEEDAAPDSTIAPVEHTESLPAWKDRPEAEQKEAQEMVKQKGLKESDKIVTKPESRSIVKRVPSKTHRTKAEISKKVDEILLKPRRKETLAVTSLSPSPPSWAAKFWFLNLAKTDSWAVNGKSEQTIVDQQWRFDLLANAYGNKTFCASMYGSGCSAVPTELFNTASVKGPFLQKWSVIAYPYAYLPNGGSWVYEPSTTTGEHIGRPFKAVPSTVNRENTYSISDQMTYGVTGGFQGSDPTATASYQYSVGSSSSYNVKDFETRQIAYGQGGRGVQWNFTGSAQSASGMLSWSRTNVSLKGIPQAAWDTFKPDVYARWDSKTGSENGIEAFAIYGTGTWSLAEITSKSYDWTGYLTSCTSRDTPFPTSVSTAFAVNWGAVSPQVP
jgi:hypothetical protein